MKRVIGKYTLFSEDEDTKLYDSIQKVNFNQYPLRKCILDYQKQYK